MMVRLIFYCIVTHNVMSSIKFVRYEVLRVVLLSIQDFCAMMLCLWVSSSGHVEGSYCWHCHLHGGAVHGERTVEH
jgi:hypothetical protein